MMKFTDHDLHPDPGVENAPNTIPGGVPAVCVPAFTAEPFLKEPRAAAFFWRRPFFRDSAPASSV